VFRARAAGLVNYFVPTSVVAHKGAVSFSGTRSPLYRYFITRNRLLFARRHLDRRARFFAWRTALWEVRQTLLGRPEPGRSCARHRLLLLASVVLAVRDYCLGRFGECPPAVRRFTRAYLAS
jgi:GT2 family glycosyltransferase